MRVIDFGTSFRSLGVFVDEYNKGKELTSKVRQTTIATAQDLIRLYAMALRRSENKNKLRGITDSILPSLFTNNVQLAQRLKISERTVQRHIQKLIQVGFISKKIWHGSNSQYELWMNESILSPARLVDEKNLFSKNTENQADENLITTTCPHTVSCTTGTDIIINTNGNKLLSKNFSCGQTEYGYETGDTGYVDAEYPKYRYESAERSPSKTQEQKIPRAGALSDSAQFYLHLLWDNACQTLYKGRSFSDLDIAQAKRYLEPYFANVPDEKLVNVFTNYSQRIELVRKYIDKDPLTRFVPPPYRYFSIHNEKGFRGTKTWHEKHSIRQKEAKLEGALNKIVSRFLKICADRKSTKDLLAVFRECEEEAKNLNSRKLLTSFYTHVCSQSPVLFSKNHK